MLLNSNEIKEQTRSLWTHCFPKESEEWIDIYFEERYSDATNITLREKAKVIAAVQAFPFDFNFDDRRIPVSYLSGLCTHPDFQRRGYASQLLRKTHRHLWDKGSWLSFLIPGDEQLRKWYESEKHGSYWTATHLLTVPVSLPEDFETDERIQISPEYEWDSEHWSYYNRWGGQHAFELKLDEPGFFAAIRTHDLEDGEVLVARKRGRIVGFCLVKRQGKLLKSGKRSTKQFQAHISFMLTTDNRVMHQFQYFILSHFEVKEITMSGGCPAQSFKKSQPYAMARIINVERFLRFIGKRYPNLQLHIGVDHDYDLPENNGYYLLEDGQLRITEERPETVVTPGGLAAMFLSAQPVLLAMLLDK